MICRDGKGGGGPCGGQSHAKGGERSRRSVHTRLRLVERMVRMASSDGYDECSEAPKGVSDLAQSSDQYAEAIVVFVLYFHSATLCARLSTFQHSIDTTLTPPTPTVQLLLICDGRLDSPHL